MFEDIFKVTSGDDDNTSEIFSRINKELVRFARYDMRCSHILVGRKEYKEIREAPTPDAVKNIEPEATTWTVELVEVDKDSYFAGAYIPAKGEFQEERMKRMLDRKIINESA